MQAGGDRVKRRGDMMGMTNLLFGFLFNGNELFGPIRDLRVKI